MVSNLIFEKNVLTDLKKLISFPSVSAQSKYKQAINNCAEWLSRYLNQSGLPTAGIYQTNLHPIVYGERNENKNLPTILLYGHYDVQPADPENEWSSPPFKPVIKNNYIYGRGASDDKGQLFIHIQAVRKLLKAKGRLPVNVKFLLEGEEEIGSINLKEFIQKNKELLNADVAVVSDMKILSPEQPAITYGLRGALNFEVELTGQKKDLHSGTFGGAIYNPLQALCGMLASLHDENTRINIPGFYDDVNFPSAKERTYAKEFGTTNKSILQDAGTDYAWGEKGFSLYERTTMLPSLSICGISGGYSGEGVKSIIPNKAQVKISIRLVPDQDPDDIANKISLHLKKICPDDFNMEIKIQMKAKPVLQNTKSYFFKAAADAYEKGFGASPVFLRSGGTIPVVNLFMEELNLPVMMMGFALSSDDMHGPDEKFYLPNYFNGIKTMCRFLENAGRINSKKFHYANADY
ncbi:MAG TPA: dipeptidase [Bacteroidia bacterium]|nr:dipeptidase [Bacteroidia bacterium]